MAWFRDARPGSACVYHVGSLADYRHRLATRTVELQRRQDAALPSRPMPPSEAVELQAILDTQDMLNAVTSLCASGLLHLTQRRVGEGQFSYHAIKRRAR